MAIFHGEKARLGKTLLIVVAATIPLRLGANHILGLND
jgi:hypothetical protein